MVSVLSKATINQKFLRKAIPNVFLPSSAHSPKINNFFVGPQVGFMSSAKGVNFIYTPGKLIIRRFAHRNFGPIQGDEFNAIVDALIYRHGNAEAEEKQKKNVTDKLVTYNLIDDQAFFFQCAAFVNRTVFIKEYGEVARGKELYRISREIFYKYYNEFETTKEKLPEISPDEIYIIFNNIKKGQLEQYKEKTWFKPTSFISSILLQYKGKIPIETENAALVIFKACLNHHALFKVSNYIFETLDPKTIGYKLLTNYESGKGKEISVILGGMGSGKSIFTGRDLDRARFDADDFKSFLKEYYNNNNFDNNGNPDINNGPKPSDLHLLSSSVKYIFMRQLRHSLSNHNKSSPNAVINQMVLYRPEVELILSYGNPVHIVHLFTNVEKVQKCVKEREKESGRHCDPASVRDSHIKSRDSIADTINMLKKVYQQNPDQAVDYRLFYRNESSVSKIGDYNIDDNTITLMFHGYWEEIAMFGKDHSKINPKEALEGFIKELKEKTEANIVKKFSTQYKSATHFQNMVEASDKVRRVG